MIKSLKLKPYAFQLMKMRQRGSQQHGFQPCGQAYPSSKERGTEIQDEASPGLGVSYRAGLFSGKPGEPKTGRTKEELTGKKNAAFLGSRTENHRLFSAAGSPSLLLSVCNSHPGGGG